jgi:hypothetical protein
MQVAISVIILLGVLVLVVRWRRRCDDCGARFPLCGLRRFDGVTLCDNEWDCMERGYRPGRGPE